MRLTTLIETLTNLQSRHGDCEVMCGNAEIAGFVVRPRNATDTIIILTRPKGTGPVTLPSP